MKKIGKWTLTGVIIIIAAVAFGSAISSFNNGAPATAEQTAPAQPSLADLARQHFDSVQSSIPELKDIRCLNDQCDSSVVYFDFNTIPSDIDTIMRGNAATYSKFLIDNGGNSISTVSVIATLGNTQLMECDASQGQVTKCK
ncbi:hypothetical protein KGM48_01460 [Patescibacteria group bacterium]|nr:hypothetical protein [Patescibacteria group bacterium]